MNLIKSDYFNTFRYKFLIVIYDIELKGTVYAKERRQKEKEKKEEKKKKRLCISLV